MAWLFAPHPLQFTAASVALATRAMVPLATWEPTARGRPTLAQVALSLLPLNSRLSYSTSACHTELFATPFNVDSDSQVVSGSSVTITQPQQYQALYRIPVLAESDYRGGALTVRADLDMFVPVSVDHEPTIAVSDGLNAAVFLVRDPSEAAFVRFADLWLPRLATTAAAKSSS